MKKILSILLCGALLCGFVFAQEGGLAVEAKGLATLSWGIDFGSGTKKDSPTDPAYPYHGFYNEHDLGIYIPFFDKQGFNGGSENKDADVYADVQFKAKPTASDWTDGTNVSARLVFFGAYMTVYNKPNFAAAYALGWNPITHTPWDANRSRWFNPSFAGWGTKIGYANKDTMDIDVGLKLGSNQNWKKIGADGKNYNGKESLYAIGLDFHMMPVEKYLSIDATVNSTFHAPNRYIAGITPDKATLGGKEGKNVVTNFGVKLGSEPIDGLSVGLGFDGVTGLQYTNKDGKPDATFGWDLGLTVGYKWVDFALYVCGPATQYHGYDVSDLNKWWEDGANMAMHLGFVSEESGDTNFVDGLAFHATLNMYDLLAKRNNEDVDEDYKKVMMGILNVGPDADPDVAAAKAAIEADPAYTASGKTFDDYVADPANSANPLVAAYQLAYGAVKEMIPLLSRTKKLGATIPLGLNLGVSYKRHINDSMWIKPFAEFYGETNHYKNATDKAISSFYFGFAYELGVTFSPIEKAEITAKWAHGKLNGNTYEGGWNGEYMISDPANNKCHNGTFTLGLKLIF